MDENENENELLHWTLYREAELYGFIPEWDSYVSNFIIGRKIEDFWCKYMYKSFIDYLTKLGQERLYSW